MLLGLTGTNYNLKLQELSDVIEEVLTEEYHSIRRLEVATAVTNGYLFFDSSKQIPFKRDYIFDTLSNEETNYDEKIKDFKLKEDCVIVNLKLSILAKKRHKLIYDFVFNTFSSIDEDVIVICPN